MLTKGCGVFEAAAAEGLPAIAATTIKTMIADPRFPDFFLAMSLPLAADLHVREVDPSETTLRGANEGCVPLQGEGTARFTRSGDQRRAQHVVKSG